MLTPKKYAQQVNAAYSTVMSWLQRGLIPGAERQELPSGGWYYTVPADAPPPELKPGPKKQADDQAEASPAIEADAPTKPAKKSLKK